MSVHRYYASQHDAETFAKAVRKAGGKAKVVPGNEFEVEYSPGKGRIPMGTHPRTLLDVLTPKYSGIPKYHANTYVKGNSCGRGNHDYVERGSTFKCTRCGSTKSKR